MHAATIKGTTFAPAAWLPALAKACVLGAALWALHHEAGALHYRDLRAALASASANGLLLAGLACAASSAVLTGYDQLGFAYLRKPLARGRIMLTAFSGYAISNSVGLALLSGTAVRHRFYARWGLASADLARLMAFNAVTSWLGLLTLTAACLVFHPQPYLRAGLANGAAPWLAALCLAPVLGYLVLALLRTAPLRVRGFDMPPPPLPLALGQWLLALADWMLAAAVLYLLLPGGAPPYPVLLGAFLLAQCAGLLSHVPGGLGVFDGIMALLLAPWLPTGQIVAALVLYRLLYYLLPLTLALLLLLADEVAGRSTLPRFTQALGTTAVQFTPRILSLFTFMAGALLLVSGATPAQHERLHSLARLLPLGLFETSHFVGSIAGVALLLLAQAVARRIRVAYVLTLAVLVAGIASALVKAGDWEEALLLALLLLAFLPGRRFFDRRAALFDTRFSPGWIVAIAAAFGSSLWIGLFAFRHVAYSDDLWWQVALQHDAPRFLRASLGVAVLLFGFGVARLLRPAPRLAEPPSGADLADAARVVSAQAATLPYLVWLRDKALLFNEQRTAFVMYGVRGRTWVALGDPVGPPADAAPLIRAFVQRADDYGAAPVFYQVHQEQLHHYADLGMAFAKLGEEARVDLAGFSLAGGRAKGLRAVLQRLERDGVGFRIVAADAVGALLAQLRAISDDWLAHKAAAEKGFSLGFFDEEYLRRHPVALLEHDGRPVAFANLLCGPSGEELSIDLMRFTSGAPRGAMEGLLIHIMAWGQEHGYRWFDLGMAPLSGIAASTVAPFWQRLTGFVYRHGEHFYGFKGLRAYKEKFHPTWSPRYIAYPAGRAFPLILADVAALSAGGYARIVRPGA